jgi:heme/copper-type cytochrome/quinol oxidase subunit 2
MGIITLIVGSGFLIFSAITGFIIFIGIIIMLVYLYRNWGTIFKKTDTTEKQTTTTTTTTTTRPPIIKPIGLTTSAESYVTDLQTYAEDMKNSLLIPQYGKDYLQSMSHLVFQYLPEIKQTIPLDLDVTNPQWEELMENLNKVTKLMRQSFGEMFQNNQTIQNEFR